MEINYAALKCIGAYLLVLDHGRHKEFQHLIPTIIRVVYELLAQGSSKGLAILMECLEY